MIDPSRRWQDEADMIYSCSILFNSGQSCSITNTGLPNHFEIKLRRLAVKFWAMMIALLERC